MQIKHYKTVAREAAAELKKYQDGNKLLINTGYPWLEGLKPGDIVLIGGPSFTGKSYLLSEIRKNIMNPEYNIKADKFVWLQNSLEMTNLNNLIIEFTKILGKGKKAILTKKFEEWERDRAREYVDTLSDGRFFVNEDAPTPEEFEANIVPFLEKHKDKECIFVDYDHLRFTKGDNKKAAMDKLLEIQNRLKKIYPVVFLDIAQFNREITSRAGDKEERAKIQRSDFADSDVAFTVADFVIGITVPHTLGIEQYRFVSPKFYDYLAEHFGDFNTKGNKVSFRTFGRIFYEVLKSRFVDGFNAKNIFVTQLEQEDPSEIVQSKPKTPNFKKDKVVKEEVIDIPFK